MLAPLQDKARLLRMATKLPVRYRPNASADDATAGGNAWDSGADGLGATTGLIIGDWHGAGGYSYRAGIRFIYPGGIQVAKGQHVKVAKIRFYAAESLRWPNENAVIRAQAADNPGPFATYEEVWTRTRGAASAAWNDTAPLPGQLIWTPDITALIQEVVGRPGWAKGNALVVFLDATASSGQPSGFDAGSWNTWHGTNDERMPWLYIWL